MKKIICPTELCILFLLIFFLIFAVFMWNTGYFELFRRLIILQMKQYEEIITVRNCSCPLWGITCDEASQVEIHLFKGIVRVLITKMIFSYLCVSSSACPLPVSGFLGHWPNRPEERWGEHHRLPAREQLGAQHQPCRPAVDGVWQ